MKLSFKGLGFVAGPIGGILEGASITTYLCPKCDETHVRIEDADGGEKFLAGVQS